MVVGASLIFLFLALRSSWVEVEEIISDGYVLLAAVGLAAIYALLFFLLFAAWFYTLRRNSLARVSIRAGAYVYGVSNIAKYLPGNIFHFAGRQLLGARLGWTHSAIMRATLLEVIAAIGGVCLLVLLLSLISPHDTIIRMTTANSAALSNYWRYVAVALFLAGLAAFLVVMHLRMFERVFGVCTDTVLVVLALVVTFFGFYAGLAVILTNALLATPGSLPVTLIASAFLLAWLAGFVIPGAPGGLGVRETVLVLLLAGTGDNTAIALALGLCMRVVNTLGDAVSAALAYLVGRKEVTNATANTQRTYAAY